MASVTDPKPGDNERSPEWGKLRNDYLKDHPACAACGSNEHPLEVHHVIAFHVDPSHELDMNNLLTLCEHPSHNCHLIWGHCLSFRSWNPTAREDAAAYLTKVENRPMLERT